MATIDTKNPDGSRTLAVEGVDLPADSAVADPSGAIPLNTLNTPVKPAAFVNPNPVMLPDVTKIDTTPLTLTQPETKAQGLTERLEKLNKDAIGESAYRATQEDAFNVPGLKQIQTDLTSQLTAVKNEASQIPLQLQNSVEGRGVTTGGLNPIQTGALRNNAIKALSVNSLLEASRGNLTTAIDLVDRAVNQKFDPIKEEIAATKANLDIILKSPEYSVADKNRAKIQLALQDAKEQENTKQKEAAKTILTTATNAAANVAGFVPTPEFTTASAAINAISQANSPEEALRIATETGLTVKAPTSAMIEEYQYAKSQGYTGSFTQYQNEDANRKRLATGGLFTTTQTNSGAANAGMTTEEFASLPKDVQNIFINNKDAGQLIVNDIAGVKSGEVDRADAIDDINGQNISQPAKDYFISLLPGESTQGAGGGGFTDWIKGFFGFGG